MLNIVLVATSRCLLVLLFLPFSALDKVLNFRDAQAQAALALHNRLLSRLVGQDLPGGTGLLLNRRRDGEVDVVGAADRMAALVFAGYCVMTALLWKQFWKSGDFRLQGPSRGRDTFWDFLKNFALAGGFLSLTFAGHAVGVGVFLEHPFDSSHPYRTFVSADREVSR